MAIIKGFTFYHPFVSDICFRELPSHRLNEKLSVEFCSHTEARGGTVQGLAVPFSRRAHWARCHCTTDRLFGSGGLHPDYNVAFKNMCKLKMR